MPFLIKPGNVHARFVHASVLILFQVWIEEVRYKDTEGHGGINGC